MVKFANDPIARTSLWATEENFWLEGPDFYRAPIAGDTAMWFRDRDRPLAGAAILDALNNAPRWESVVFSNPSMEVQDDRVILRYHATASAEGRDACSAHCLSTHVVDAGALKPIEHRQRAL